jgi:hypothetical protein
MNELCSSLIPVQTNKIRLGPNSDGGYVLGKRYLSHIIYSYGVGNNIEFEESYLKFFPDTKIYLFDGTIEKLPPTTISQHRNIKFFKNNVYKEEDLNITEDECLVMMDIEGSEFDLILSTTEYTFKKIKQLCIEVHFNKKLSLQKTLEFFDRLNHYFYLVHIHANNHKKRLYFNVPCVLELTYINKKYFSEDIVKETGTFPIKNLDFPNVKHKSDFMINWWTK